MYLTQEKPYRPLLIALIFLTLPLALLLHEIITVGLFRHSGLLLTFQDGQLRQVAGWDDAIVWFICGVFGFFNLMIAGGLTKLAYKKMMRRHFRYALFLSGAAACAAALVVIILESLLGSAALGSMRQGGIFLYALSVWILAMLTLPRQLTRAPEQPIIFHKMKR